ncbi:MAG: enoyl-CoA hydratase [Desulfobacterales bacterium]|nr:enoyl-CoA hydratase [Desulfobacterales bacterium]
MEKSVLLDIEGRTAWIILNRPDRRNAMNQALLAQLYDALETVSENDELLAAVLTGNGKSFCSGLDLGIIAKENLFDPRGDGTDLMDILSAFEKPLIGAINGHAITGGFELALNCDFLIASEKASFADTHAKVGIHPGWGMTQLLQQAIGQQRAKQMSFTGAFIQAEQACRWGLVNEVVPHEMLLPRAREIARQMARLNPDMLGIVKKLIETRNTESLASALARERQGFDQFLSQHLKSGQ